MDVLVINAVTEYIAACSDEARHDGGQIGKGGFAVDQRIEALVGQQLKHMAKPSLVGPCRAMGGRDAADLR